MGERRIGGCGDTIAAKQRRALPMYATLKQLSRQVGHFRSNRSAPHSCYPNNIRRPKTRQNAFLSDFCNPKFAYIKTFPYLCNRNNLSYILYKQDLYKLYDNLILYITMSKATTSTLLPRRAKQNLATVGEQIRCARLRRNLTIEQIAERAGCSQPTVIRVEKGNPSVAMGTYLRVLYAIGIDQDILLLAQNDPLGRTLQDLNLPHRRRATTKKETQA